MLYVRRNVFVLFNVLVEIGCDVVVGGLWKRLVSFLLEERFGEVSTVIILGGMKEGVNGQTFDRDDSRACLVGSGGIAVLVRG
ncbi:hypothetical protein L1887_29863 [Cichorium endivia]|nr:hypothetical protein L1887_29863 [Cichorium endivia]